MRPHASPRPDSPLTMPRAQGGVHLQGEEGDPWQQIPRDLGQGLPAARQQRPCALPLPQEFAAQLHRGPVPRHALPVARLPCSSRICFARPPALHVPHWLCASRFCFARRAFALLVARLLRTALRSVCRALALRIAHWLCVSRFSNARRAFAVRVALLQCAPRFRTTRRIARLCCARRAFVLRAALWCCASDRAFVARFFLS